jgi:O-acetyl-ADP-ribose deacetylase (regulator of RNase III)
VTGRTTRSPTTGIHPHVFHEVAGDILLTRAQVTAHGVAPNDHFSVGLALSLRERWPAMYKDFRHYSNTRHPHPGELWAWAGVGGTRIVSLFTQDGGHGHGDKPGRATEANVNHALRALHKLAIDERYTSIALPRLATGVGGLHWEQVYPLIRTHLGSLNIPIVLYVDFRPGEQAVEPL